MEVQDENYLMALEEIERGKSIDGSNAPVEQKGGEVLESVNEVFNLMAMKIDTETRARQQNEAFLKSYKKLPDVIYIKNPRDRLLLMTEDVDQSF